MNCLAIKNNQEFNVNQSGIPIPSGCRRDKMCMFFMLTKSCGGSAHLPSSK